MGNDTITDKPVERQYNRDPVTDKDPIKIEKGEVKENKGVQQAQARNESKFEKKETKQNLTKVVANETVVIPEKVVLQGPTGEQTGLPGGTMIPLNGGDVRQALERHFGHPVNQAMVDLIVELNNLKAGERLPPSIRVWDTTTIYAHVHGLKREDIGNVELIVPREGQTWDEIVQELFLGSRHRPNSRAMLAEAFKDLNGSSTVPPVVVLPGPRELGRWYVEQRACPREVPGQRQMVTAITGDEKAFDRVSIHPIPGHTYVGGRRLAETATFAYQDRVRRMQQQGMSAAEIDLEMAKIMLAVAAANHFEMSERPGSVVSHRGRVYFPTDERLDELLEDARDNKAIEHRDQLVAQLEAGQELDPASKAMARLWVRIRRASHGTLAKVDEFQRWQQLSETERADALNDAPKVVFERAYEEKYNEVHSGSVPFVGPVNPAEPAAIAEAVMDGNTVRARNESAIDAIVAGTSGSAEEKQVVREAAEAVQPQVQAFLEGLKDLGNGMGYEYDPQTEKLTLYLDDKDSIYPIIFAMNLDYATEKRLIGVLESLAAQAEGPVAVDLEVLATEYFLEESWMAALPSVGSDFIDPKDFVEPNYDLLDNPDTGIGRELEQEEIEQRLFGHLTRGSKHTRKLNDDEVATYKKDIQVFAEWIANLKRDARDYKEQIVRGYDFLVDWIEKKGAPPGGMLTAFQSADLTT